MTPERSIYAYDPRIPPERELERRIRAQIASQRGTCAQVRYGDQWILTCSCGALTVTLDMAAPARFREDHKDCRLGKEGTVSDPG